MIKIGLDEVKTNSKAIRHQYMNMNHEKIKVASQKLNEMADKVIVKQKGNQKLSISNEKQERRFKSARIKKNGINDDH